MSYTMFIDDEREPSNAIMPCIVVRSSSEAIVYVKKHGCPNYIHFDHDLGGSDTSMKFIHWLINSDLDDEIIPEDFGYSIHSQNPVGRDNINKLLGQYLKLR